MKNVGALFRTQEWLRFRISPLFLPLYFVLLQTDKEFEQGISLYLPLFLFFLSTAALGYFLNDLSDIETDKKARTENKLGKLSKASQVIILFTLLASSGISAILLPLSPVLLTLIATEILCFLISSFPPLRMKGRPLGILVDACSAYIIPFSIAAVVSGTLLEAKEFETLFFLSLSWQFFQGLRHTLGHQTRDAEADSRSGVKTPVLSIGNDQARLWQSRILPILELSSLVLLFFVLPYGVLYSLFFLTFLGFSLRKAFSARQRGYRLLQDAFLGDRLLNPFSLSWLPLALLALLSVEHPAYLILLIAQLVLFGRPKVETPPTPPSWQFSLNMLKSGTGLSLEGWILNSDIFTRGIEVSLDGLSAARMSPVLTNEELGKRYAQDSKNFSSFHGVIPVPGHPAERQSLSVRIYSRDERQERVFLEYSEIRLEMTEKKEGAETFEQWASVYRKDFRPQLRRDAEGFPTKILVFNLSEPLREFTEKSLFEALSVRGFEIIPTRAAEDVLERRKPLSAKPHAFFVSSQELSLHLLLSDRLAQFKEEGFLLMGFHAEHERDVEQILPVNKLDFFGPFTTPVFNHFVSRYLGVESFVASSVSSDSRTRNRCEMSL